MKPKWAFNSASVMHLAWEEELRLLRKHKWRAVELWFDKMKACMEKGRTCADLGAEMRDAGLDPIGMAPAVVWTESERHDSHHEHLELSERLDVTAALGAQALSVVVLGRRGHDLAREYDRLVEKLRNVALMAAQRGIRINLEFIGGYPVNGTMGTCIELIQRADQSNLGMLLDMCNYYTSASHVEELERLPSGRLFMVHVNDALSRPMEELGNDHRCWPGEGRIDVALLMTEIAKRARYKGFWSMDLYDKDVWEMDPAEVFRKTAASLKKLQKQLA